MATARIALLALTLLIVASVSAEVPHSINYQGRLTDTDGAIVPDGDYSVTFRIYDESSTVLWTESHMVQTANGLLAVALGSNGTPLTDEIFSGNECYLGVTVEPDPEISPRTKLFTVPWAFRVNTLDGANAGTVNGDMEINGELRMLGAGVRFPDGTLQTSAASTFDPFANLFWNHFSFQGSEHSAPVPAFDTPVDQSVYLTQVNLAFGGPDMYKCFLYVSVDGSEILSIFGADGIANYFWSSNGGAPIHIPPGSSVTVRGSTDGGTMCDFVVTFTGYQF